jgi:Na+/melibiose symporter-like transporter
VHSRDRVWLIYVVAAAYGTASILFGSARSALLTEMLPERLLPSANAALQSISESMRLVAPVAGAGLFALLGGGAVAALDSLTFLASAACLARLRHHDVRPTPGESHFVAQLTAGARHIARTPALRRVVLAVAVTLLVVGFAETLIFTVIQVQLHRRPSFFGVLGFAQGVGAVAGGLAAAAALRRLGDARLVAAGMALFAVGDGLLLVPDVAVVLAGIAVAGVGISWASRSARWRPRSSTSGCC